MDYSEVSSAFFKLVETHFLQRCPPLEGAGATESSTEAPGLTPAAPGLTPAASVSTTLPTPESFADCYKVPHVTLTGRGKRQLPSEEGEDQRNAKRAKMDADVSDLLYILEHICNLNSQLIFIILPSVSVV